MILLFVLTRSLNIDILQQSNASIFTPLSYLFWRLSYRSYGIFWKRLGLFWDSQKIIFGFFYLFLIWSPIHKIVDGRGRNLMCHCTLPSRLVYINNSPRSRIFAHMEKSNYRLHSRFNTSWFYKFFLENSVIFCTHFSSIYHINSFAKKKHDELHYITGYHLKNCFRIVDKGL